MAYIDSDMDGVEDKNDKCANTPLTELVDLSGCSIKSLVSPHHFDILLGESYSKDSTSTLNLSSLTFDYYYKKWSVQLSTSFYKTSSETLSSSGVNDTYLNFSYLFVPYENFYLTLGGGVIFPTYDTDDNKVDYTSSIYGRYKVGNLSFIVGLGYGKIGDNNSDNIVSYKNILSYTIGSGYNWNKNFYSSISYSNADSIFENSDDLESLSLYNYYNFNKHWFSTINYRYGFLSNGSRQTIGVNLGYNW